MGVYINEKKASNLVIKVVEEKDAVYLRYNNHNFVKCYTNKDGDHVVEIIDIDTGVIASQNIDTTCWRR
jgi:hypothetical protein